MKYLLFLLAFYSVVNVNAQSFLKTDSVYIKGKVSNHHKHKDSANTVSIIVNDIVFGDQLTYLSKIKNDGTYSIAFIKTGAQDVMMLYGDDIENILVTPKAHMQIDFDADSFANTRVFKGDNAKANQDLNLYEAEVEKERLKAYGNDRYSRSRKLAESEKSAEPEAHKKFLADRYSAEKGFLDNYLSRHKADPFFASWTQADLKYGYLENLMRYVWLHPMYNKMKGGTFEVPNSYYDFVNDKDLNATQSAISSNFGAYLKSCKSELVSKKFGSRRLVADELTFYADQPKTLYRDMMFSQWFYRMIKSKNLDGLGGHLNSYKASITDAGFRNRVVEYYDAAMQKLNNYKLPVNARLNKGPVTEADSLFNKIIAKYAGKVVYVDFWATWCGPCRAEMPNSAKLRGKYAGKDVVFLYLGVQSKEKTWKALISELNIQGEHFLLNDNDAAVIMAKYQISGIPRYMLVDKQGRVVYEDAKRPSDGKLPVDIDQLLVAK